MAISPQVNAKNAEMKRRHKLAFPVLSDPGNAYAGQLSLVHRLPEDLQKVYTGLGIVLPAFNGDDSWELPLAARLLVDRHGVLRDLNAGADYTVRPEPGLTLELLRSLV